MLSGTARWVVASAGGDGATFWDQAGTDTSAFSHPGEHDAGGDLARLGQVGGIDVALA